MGQPPPIASTQLAEAAPSAVSSGGLELERTGAWADSFRCAPDGRRRQAAPQSLAARQLEVELLEDPVTWIKTGPRGSRHSLGYRSPIGQRPRRIEINQA